MSAAREQVLDEAVERDVKSGATSKFRFKAKRKHRSDDHHAREAPDNAHDDSRDDRERRHRHHHHHRSKRRRPSPEQEVSPDDAPPRQAFDPDVAFRESLFDAMADDEGAQYWEGVYGQPIHNYSDMKQSPTGELEQMTDEEYTAYVRAKMYEKTHQHLIEEKARRDAARKERAERAKEGERARHEDARFRDKVEESLRRGEERRSGKAWMARWTAYTEKWQKLGSRNSTSSTDKVHLASIPWPVESGKREDVSEKAVERFFVYAPSSGKPTESQLHKILKVERVRWHPDKIQQKWGGQDVNEDVIQAVTEVFQVIDQLWSSLRREEA